MKCLRCLRTAEPPSRERGRKINLGHRKARRWSTLLRSRQVRPKFRGMWSSRDLPFAKRLVRRHRLRDRNAGRAALDKGVTIKAAEAEADAGGKAVEVKAKVTVIKDAIFHPRNTPRRARIRRRVASRVDSLLRNCRPTTSQSFCRASP